jgi:hypothetical protein
MYHTNGFDKTSEAKEKEKVRFVKANEPCPDVRPALGQFKARSKSLVATSVAEGNPW